MSWNDQLWAKFLLFALQVPRASTCHVALALTAYRLLHLEALSGHVTAYLREHVHA